MGKPYTMTASAKDGAMEVKFSGNLIINHIEKIYEELQELIVPGQPLSIVVDNPENMDITFVQMIVSVKHLWKEKGSEVHVKSELKDDLKALLSKSGLDREMNY